MQRPITGTAPRARGRFWNDITWGGEKVLKVTIPPGGGSVASGDFATLETICQYEMFPARLVALLAVLQASTKPAFVADGTTWTVNWSLGLGIGRSHTVIGFSQAWAPPYDALIFGGGNGAVMVPAKQLTLTAELVNAATVAAGSYGVRISAFAAPYSLGGLGLEELGGSAG